MWISVGSWVMGPWNIMFALAIVVVSVLILLSGRRDLLWVAAAFVVSWVAAQVVTVTGIPEVSGAGLMIATILCVYANSHIANSIAFLYAVRVGVVLVSMTGVISMNVMWAWTEVFLALQLILALGGSIDGITRRFNLVSANHRRRIHAYVHNFTPWRDTK